MRSLADSWGVIDDWNHSPKDLMAARIHEFIRGEVVTPLPVASLATSSQGLHSLPWRRSFGRRNAASLSPSRVPKSLSSTVSSDSLGFFLPPRDRRSRRIQIASLRADGKSRCSAGEIASPASCERLSVKPTHQQVSGHHSRLCVSRALAASYSTVEHRGRFWRVAARAGREQDAALIIG